MIFTTLPTHFLISGAFSSFSVALFSYNDLLWVNGAIDLRVGVRDENKGRVESMLTDSPTIEKQNNK